MRPAVYASVMRTRKTGVRRVKSQPHTFSWRRFFLMLFVGVVMFIPGLIVTIISIESADQLDEMPGDRVFYKFIAPASLAVGIGLVCASGIYYCCWGFQSPVSREHSRKYKKSKTHSDKYDPVQTNTGSHHGSHHHEHNSSHSPHNSSRSKGQDGHHHHHHHHHKSVTPEQRSGRHGNGAGTGAHSQRHRTPSKTSTGESQRSQHQQAQSSRHRNSSQSRYSSSNHTHPNSQTVQENTPHSTMAPSQKRTTNQVTFINTTAPLATGETASMDISIDIDGDIEEDKKC